MCKAITEETLEKANTYVPLQKKLDFVTKSAESCFDFVEIAVGDSRTRYYKESPGMKKRFLMGFLLKEYLHMSFEPIEGETHLMYADEYDAYAGSHIINQLNRLKKSELRDKAFDLLADYQEVEKLFGAEIRSLLEAANEPVHRASVMLKELVEQSMTPDGMEELKAKLDAYNSKEN